MLLLKNLKHMVSSQLIHWQSIVELQTQHKQYIQGDEFIKLPMINSELHSKWKTFQHYSSKKQESDTKTQLKDLTSHEMLVTMFPKLSALANISLHLLNYVFLVKKNRIGENSLNLLMLISIESPDCEELMNLTIVSVWNENLEE